jgi:hypothetical protein
VFIASTQKKRLCEQYILLDGECVKNVNGVANSGRKLVTIVAGKNKKQVWLQQHGSGAKTRAKESSGWG